MAVSRKLRYLTRMLELSDDTAAVLRADCVLATADGLTKRSPAESLCEAGLGHVDDGVLYVGSRRPRTQSPTVVVGRPRVATTAGAHVC